MNALCYKTVFSKHLGALVAVGEHATSQSKGQGAGAASGAGSLGSGLRFLGVISLGFAAVSLAWSQTLPQGGRVSQGQVTISQSGQQMAITQSTSKAVVNWDSFDIGANAKVNVVQPSSQSVLLNRVLSDNPTQILGQLQANGQVVLVNPKGIVVGSDGSVSASAFTASTLNISDADFMAGNGRYTREGSTGEVVNKGRISVTPGGYVALLGARVSNEGQIIAPQGSVALGAAETVTVPIGRTGKIKLELTPASINASVANQKGGVIVAEGGQVYMQAAALGQAVASVLHSGHIDTSGAQAGAVHLLADGGQIKVDGSITANSSGQDDQGQLRKGGDIVIGRDLDTNALAAVGDVRGATLESQGGFIETSGAYLATDGVNIKAKDWLLDPSNITISTATDSNVTGTSPADTTPTSGSTTSVVNVGTIQTAINSGTNVTITTTNTGTAGSSVGNITVNSALSFTNNSGNERTLKLIADNGIFVNANITTNAGSGSGLVNIDLLAKGIPGGNASSYTATDSNGIVVNTNVSMDTNGTIKLDGTNHNTNANSRGITFNAGAKIKASSFDIQGKATGSGSGSHGVHINGGSATGTTFTSTGSGNSVINGTSRANITGITAATNINGTNVRFDAQGTGAMVVKGSNALTALGLRISAGGDNTTVFTKGDVTLGALEADSSFSMRTGTITAETGHVKIRGQSATAGTSVGGNSTLKTLADGANIDIVGLAATTASNQVGKGVDIVRLPEAPKFETKGNITIEGTVTGTGTGSGVLFSSNGWGSQAVSMIADGNITIRGNNRASAANTANALYINTGLQAVAKGNITLQAETNNAASTALLLLSQRGTNVDAGLINEPLTGNTSLQSINAGGIAGNILVQANQGSLVLNNSAIAVGSTSTKVSIPAGSTETKLVGQNITIDNTGAGMAIGAGNAVAGTGGTQGAALSNGGSIDATSGAITAGSGKSRINHGINFADNRDIQATGNLNILGASTAGDGVRSIAKMEAGEILTITGQTETAGNRAVVITSSGGLNGTLKVTDGKTIHIHANALTLEGAATVVDAGTTGTVNIKTRNGNEIVVGAADTLSATLASQKLGLDQAELNRINAGQLVLGDTASAGPITVSGAVTTAATTGDIRLQTGGNIAVNAALTVGDAAATKNLSLNATGASSTVTQTAAIKANGLELLGSNASVVLANSGNDVQTLAGNVKSVEYFDTNALTLGTVNTAGLSATGTIKVESNANLTVSQAVSTNNATDNALVLNAGKSTNAGTATGGDISFTGSGGVSVGGSGRATLFTGSVAGSTGLGIIEGHNRFNSDELFPVGYTTPLGSGIYAIYRENRSLSVSFGNAAKTYDGNAYTGGSGFTATGLVGNDTVALLGSAVYSGNAQGAVNAGTYEISGSSSGSAVVTALGYSLSYNNGALTVNKANLSATGTKVYDAATTFAGSSFTSIAGVNGETFTATGSGTLANPNVQSAQTLQSLGTLSLVGVSGALASNYNWTTASSSVSVTPRSLTVTGANNTVTYNGAAQTNSGATIDGIQGNDSFTISGYGTGTNASTTAYADNLLVAGTSGTLLSNYSIAYINRGLTIGKANLTLSGTRVYDAGTTFAGQHLIATGVAGQTFSVTGSGDASNLANKNVQANQPLNSLTGLALGASANNGLVDNYNAISTTGSSVSVTPKALTVIATAADKAYDATLLATVNSINSADIIGNDTVNIAYSSANFANKNVARDASGGIIGQSVTVSGLSLSGADAGNYSIASETVTSAKITPKALTVAVSVADKVYDGGTSATVSAKTSNDIFSGDAVSIGFAAANFADKNVARDANGNVMEKTATVSGLSLTGADAGNYSLTSTTATDLATISAKALTVSVSVGDKVYDAGTAATVSAKTSSDILGGDTVSILHTAANFADKNVARDPSGQVVNQTATVSGLSLSGTHAGNYVLQNTSAAGSAKITPKALTASLIGNVSKEYDGTVAAQVAPNNFSLTGWAHADEGATVSPTTATYASATVAGNQGQGLVSTTLQATDLTPLQNTLLSNYTLPNSAAGQVGTITRAPLTIKLGNTSMFVTQDPNTAVDPGFALEGQLKNGETADAVLGTLTRSYQGAANPVSGSYSAVYGLSVAPNPDNYAVIVQKGNLTVVPADHLLIHVGGEEVTYGALSSALAGHAATQVQAQYCLVANDCNGANIANLSMSQQNSRWTATDVSNSSVSFNTVVNTTGKVSGGGYLNVGSYSFEHSDLRTTGTVNFNGVAINSGLLKVSPKALSLSANAVQKEYDGTASLSGVVLTPSGALEGDALRVIYGAGSFAGKNAGPQGFTLSGLALQGADQANYVLGSAQLSGTGTITPKAITVSGLQAQDKVYDGSTQASVQTSGALFNGIVAGDQLSVTATGQFDTRHAGTHKAVSLSSSFGGADLDNYSITPQASSTASITPAPLVVTASAARKTYDGNTTAPGVGTVGALAGAAAGDTVAFAGSLAFTNKNAGTGKTVTVTGVRLVDGSNTDVSGNYAITYV
ncbi:YDG domain-containing protein, partial [Limnohabitans sp.]|uniref:YDG domain-containing protein n=1 Tax=Limnohabitans sp. TaxID=1907725 RepID=UPI0031FCE196